MQQSQQRVRVWKHVATPGVTVPGHSMWMNVISSSMQLRPSVPLCSFTTFTVYPIHQLYYFLFFFVFSGDRLFYVFKCFLKIRISVILVLWTANPQPYVFGLLLISWCRFNLHHLPSLDFQFVNREGMGGKTHLLFSASNSTLLLENSLNSWVFLFFSLINNEGKWKKLVSVESNDTTFLHLQFHIA